MDGRRDGRREITKERDIKRDRNHNEKDRDIGRL